MRFSVFLSRHGRLACLCLASLLAHLLALSLLDVRLAPPDLAPMGPLALRLAESRPTPSPAPVAAPLPDPAPAAGVPKTAAADTRLPSLVAAAPAQSAAPAPIDTAPGGAGGTTVPMQMPGRYRVTPPPSARLDYVVVRSTPGAAPAAEGSARLDWESDGNTYRLRLDGVLGERASEGGTDDAGIAPLRATLASGTGAAATLFDRERMAIVDGGKSTRLAPGAQDGASVLMQLAGIGLSDPDQMQDVLEIVVSDENGPAIARFQVLGKENVETGGGAFEAVRLVRLAPPGSGRLEVWLAPQRDWLPVQLRVTAPDGTARTQTLAAPR
ncbi:DUF3108 domain-containing protein [Massilia niastensis]|uniref:DUF3108 domain-containing protein n=1 Tax=Massilia niastensis TaxID=544911 RepID=UPI00035DD0DA|nr:DUF3108 domain-containing protein [Massilia niastensis]